MGLAISLFVLGAQHVRAQHEGEGTARGLWALASDGARVHVGEVTGRLFIAPARSERERFGPIRVRAGLVLEARADAESELPVYAVGVLASGMIETTDEGRVVQVESLYRRGRGRRDYARLRLGDVTLEPVPLDADQV
ncbi:MAG: hypothetical protein KC464_31510, partial [Myxococcales bacterium]|nr:hypothetical protein [Myxococcales bacterium]